MDVLDHLIGDDLKQAATIIASFVWNTSQRDEMIPRKKQEYEVEGMTKKTDGKVKMKEEKKKEKKVKKSK
jgi:hypothetical protein